MEISLEILILSIPFLGVILAALIYLARYIWKQRKSHTLFQFAWEIVTLPLFFSKIFNQQRKERQLPLYFQYFLNFTRFCSRIPYFHFLPKFLVATIAEFFIHSITDEPILTAMIFTWSFSFFLLISIVESMHGELEEEIVTLANKIFLFSVSVLLIFSIILWFFFWEWAEPILHNPILEAMSKVTEMFNEQLGNFTQWVWHLPILGKIAIILVVVIYIYSSLYLSRRGIK